MTENKVRREFETRFGKDYRLFSAPGRINVIGEHTDYNDGFVLPAAIDKKIYLAIHPTGGKLLHIVSVDFDDSVEVDVDGPQPELPHWALYPYGVIKELQVEGCNVGGFEAVFCGDIPTGAGLSSSAAIESAFAAALNELFAFRADKFTLAKIGQRAEHNFVGVRCGIMDQFASFFGKKDHVIRLDCRSLEHAHFPLALQDYKLILSDTRVKHSLASSAYNTRRQQCEDGVEVVRKKYPEVKSLRDASLGMLDEHKALLGEEAWMRCSYVVEENQRVLDTCEALLNGDIEKVGALMFLSHRGLRDKYEVSCKELDLLVETAENTEGIIGSRMMGGGFGGCTITLARISALNEFKQKASDAFFNAFGHHPLFYDVNTGDGAGED